MRNLDASELFAQPNLKSIKEDPENQHYGAQASIFNLTFYEVNPNAPEGGEEGPRVPVDPKTRGKTLAKNDRGAR
jgi:hypothetical protein